MHPQRDGGRAFADKQVFTTGEAAQACGVSQQTIIRCFDSGRLGGFRVPGSKFRRIPRTDLLDFMNANGIPHGTLSGEKPRVLVVDDDEGLLSLVKEVLSSEASDKSTAYAYRSRVYLTEDDPNGLESTNIWQHSGHSEGRPTPPSTLNNYRY